MYRVSSLLDVQNEKNAQNLFSGIEQFDHQNLKHAVTQEKNPLPDQEGTTVGRSKIEEMEVMLL